MITAALVISAFFSVVALAVILFAAVAGGFTHGK